MPLGGGSYKGGIRPLTSRGPWSNCMEKDKDRTKNISDTEMKCLGFRDFRIHPHCPTTKREGPSRGMATCCEWTGPVARAGHTRKWDKEGDKPPPSGGLPGTLPAKCPGQFPARCCRSSSVFVPIGRFTGKCRRASGVGIKWYVVH